MSCNEPLRDKSRSCRTIINVFFTLATLSVVARYATHFTVGRSNLFDNVNMGLGYVSNAVHSSEALLTLCLASERRTLRMLYPNVLSWAWAGHVDS